MQKKIKIVAGSAAALALIVAGGFAIALPAQAAPVGTSTSVVGSGVDTPAATDTDNVQDQVGDQTGTDAADATEAGGTETADAPETGTETPDAKGTENTSDDINGVAVEDGTKG